MKRPFEMRNFKGLVSNADLEDVSPEYLQTMSNYRERNGRLVKTFGLGNKIAGATAADIKVLAAFINDNLSTDFMYVGAYINPSTFVVTVYLCSDGATWVAASTVFTMGSTTFYHKDGFNPVLQSDGALRLLPGNVAKADGSNESEGIWIGYIDRTYFDEIYDPAETADAKFYAYPTSIDPVALTVTPTEVSGGSMDADVYHYKFTYIYDGEQESLPSAHVAVDLATGYFPKLSFSITLANHNKRVTGMNVYRSTAADGIYYLIQTINFLRDSSDIYGTNNGYWGEHYFYVPDLTSYSFISGSDCDYCLDIGGTNYALKNLSGTGNTRLQVVPVGDLTHGGSGAPIGADIWDSAWTLQKWNGSAYADIAPTSQTGTDGAFGGTYAVITDTEMGVDTLVNEVLLWFESASPAIRIISNNNGKAIKYSGAAVSSVSTAKPWKALRSATGLYYATDNTTTADYVFYDQNIEDGEEFPLSGETSIKVNSKFALIMNERKFQAHIVLDPGGSGEVHENWISWSELGQLDVNPVSNVRVVNSAGGGPITGLAQFGGMLAVEFEHSVVFIDVETYPNDPERWKEEESTFGIGNVAERGSISVLGSLFTCGNDGIYRLDRAQVPDKITEIIEDEYLNLTATEKAGILSAYDRMKDEVLFYMGRNFSGSDLCAGGAISADSELSAGYVDDYAFDNDTATEWSSTNTALPHWIKYDFGAGQAKRIEKVRIMAHINAFASKSYLKDFTVQGSNDDATYTTLYTGRGADISEAVYQDFEFYNSTAYRYIKINVTTSWTSLVTITAFYEVEMYSAVYNGCYAYNIKTGGWRKVETAVVIAMFANDEKGNVLAFQNSDNLVYSSAVRESVIATLKTIVIPVTDDDTKDVIRYLSVTYKGTAKTINLYAEHGAGEVATFTLAANTALNTYKQRIGYWATKAEVEIVDSAASTSDDEIHKILIE